MGYVTFNGDTATPESQVFIEQRKLEILQSSSDEFTKARQLERLYIQNGLIPGTMIRAGSLDTKVARRNAAFSDTFGKMVTGGIKYLMGMFALLLAIHFMSKWGF